MLFVYYQRLSIVLCQCCHSYHLQSISLLESYYSNFFHTTYTQLLLFLNCNALLSAIISVQHQKFALEASGFPCFCFLGIFSRATTLLMIHLQRASIELGVWVSFLFFFFLVASLSLLVGWHACNLLGKGLAERVSIWAAWGILYRALTWICFV